MLLETKVSGDALQLQLSGEWAMEHIAEIERSLADVGSQSFARVRVDASRLTSLDLSAAWLLRARLEAFQERGAKVEFTGIISAAIISLSK